MLNLTLRHFLCRFLCHFHGMQADATARAGHKPVHSPADHLGTPYQKVVDGRKRPIRGLWQRNGRFYARLSIEDTQTGRKTVRRVPLVGVSTVAEATAALRKLETQRAESNLPVIRRTPKFDDYAKQYLEEEVCPDRTQERRTGRFSGPAQFPG